MNMKDFWFKYKKRANNLAAKVNEMLGRDPNRARLILWRNRITAVMVYLDKHLFRITAIVILAFFVYSLFYFFAWRAPRPFPEQALVTVERGEPLSQIVNSFEEQGVVRSAFWLRALVTLLDGEREAVAGDYYFPKPVSVFRVAKMLHSGEFGLIAIKITIPEGLNSHEIAEIFESNLPAFNGEDFIDEVVENNYEGYLFPDTYFLTPNTKSGDIILMMRENFARQIKPYEEDITKSERSLNDLVNVASIVEDEANGTLESKRIVAGIIWKRLRLDMPLQVDAPFQYYNGKNSYTLTKEDLAEDHDYNTYTNKGLPPTAIANPGIDSLRAAIAPTNTEYLYFLSDRHGNLYYAKTFEEHKLNRELYLN